VTKRRIHDFSLALLVIGLLAGLPIAVWLDLRNLSDATLRRQAADLKSVITSMRAYYASNVVGRILASPGSTQVVPITSPSQAPSQSQQHFPSSLVASSPSSSTI
jgi:hypothetical protein